MQAIGGSTNGLIHLTAIANRTAHRLDLDAFDRLGRDVPVLVDLKPSGAHYMEHFHHAGGVPRLMAELGDLVDIDAKTVAGGTLRDVVSKAQPVPGEDAIRGKDNPIKQEGAMAVLRGNLAPDGAVIKPAAAEARLLRHTGPAVVFADYNDMAARIDDPALVVTADSVLVLKHAGPLGAPGMPEWGQLPIPKKILATGVRDMLRISDARMSGTSYGACVLHVAPESWVGGPLALVEDGDLIELDVPARRLELKVSAAELARRRAAWKRPARKFERGFGALYQQHITQADHGCDFDFLEGTAPTPDPEIH
jgi:dihydroxy-acid dehydratase